MQTEFERLQTIIDKLKKEREVSHSKVSFFFYLESYIDGISWETEEDKQWFGNATGAIGIENIWWGSSREESEGAPSTIRCAFRGNRKFEGEDFGTGKGIRGSEKG